MADNIIENLTDRLQRLPSIGKKSAKRLAYHIVNMPPEETDKLVEAISLAKSRIMRCKLCNTYSQEKICPLCANEARDRSKLLVVGSVRDMDSFEETMCYDGLYFVLLEEAINPLRGIGPRELGVDAFLKRLDDAEVEEVILALSSNVESEQTATYLKSLAQKAGKKVSRISQGIPVGGVLEYYDPLTIQRAYENRREME